ncbi:MAG: DUF4291 domain-containing protein [Cyclobacteriaceae bacterium]
MPLRSVRAVYDDTTITVYQAYRSEIALKALEHQTFVSPFKVSRMTWIKPSFLWMMYRSGCAQKEGQENILAIKISREGFEWALDHACLSHYENTIYNSHEEWTVIKDQSPVRVQWDPERDIHLKPLNYRSIQIGLSSVAVEKYVNDWIIDIKDITPICKKMSTLIESKSFEDLKSLLPVERPYLLPSHIAKRIGAT